MFLISTTRFFSTCFPQVPYQQWRTAWRRKDCYHEARTTNAGLRLQALSKAWTSRPEQWNPIQVKVSSLCGSCRWPGGTFQRGLHQGVAQIQVHCCAFWLGSWSWSWTWTSWQKSSRLKFGVSNFWRLQASFSLGGICEHHLCCCGQVHKLAASCVPEQGNHNVDSRNSSTAECI